MPSSVALQNTVNQLEHKLQALQQFMVREKADLPQVGSCHTLRASPRRHCLWPRKLVENSKHDHAIAATHTCEGFAESMTVACSCMQS